MKVFRVPASHPTRSRYTLNWASTASRTRGCSCSARAHRGTVHHHRRSAVWWTHFLQNGQDISDNCDDRTTTYD